MSNVFDMLTGGVIGEVTQDGKTYATAPTPPDGDDSTKVATTAFVKGATPSIPSGNIAVWSRGFTWYADRGTVYINAPSGGTWFCWGLGKGLGTNHTYSSGVYGTAVGGGSRVTAVSGEYNINTGDVSSMMAIKIA